MSVVRWNDFSRAREHDGGVFVCTVEAEEQIFLEHRLNVLSKWPVKETCFMYLSR